MQPMNGKQSGAVGKYLSPYGSGPGSSSPGTPGGTQSSGYSLNAHGEHSSKLSNHGSVPSHPEPNRPPSYVSPYGPLRKASGANVLSHRQSFSGSTSQSFSNQARTNSAPREILSPSPEPDDSRRFDNKPTTSTNQSQKLNSSSGYGSQKPPQPQVGSFSSRFGYPPKPTYPASQVQGGSSSTSHGRPQSDLPLPTKAPYRSSANIAHPSHYQQTNLSFSSTPKFSAAPPRSNFQVVVPTSPAKFYGKSPYSVADKRPYLSDAPSSSPRGGRPPNGSEPRPKSVDTLPKKRGRPFSNKIPVEKTPKKRGRPFSNKIPVEKTPKKRGRPFKTVESELKAKERMSQAGSSGTSTPSGSKKKGRPFSKRDQAFIKQPSPVFHAFLCEWKGCQAELQNLETLRLHVHVVHRKREDGKVPCLWGKCGVKKVVVIEGEESGGETNVMDNHPTFARRQDWKDHLEEKHLVPFSWHMGDGPKATDLSNKPKGIISPRWLSDSNGKRVTPSVHGQPLEEGRVSILNKKRFRKMRGIDAYQERKASKLEIRGMGMGGMAPPEISSDDEAEAGDTGLDEGGEMEGGDEEDEEDEEKVDEGEESEGLDDRRAGGSRVVRLMEVKDDEDEVMGSDGERYEDIDDEGDLQMMGL